MTVITFLWCVSGCSVAPHPRYKSPSNRKTRETQWRVALA